MALAIFFWTLPTLDQVARLKHAGIKVWMQVGRVAEAEQAAALGADALIVQGAEAGGHNRAEASIMTSILNQLPWMVLSLTVTE